MNSEEQSTKNRFAGKLVRLAAFDTEKDTEALARWGRDSEYQQLLDSGPARLYSARSIKEWMEKNADEIFNFAIRAIEDDQIIGQLDLSGIDWVTGTSWIGIGIGERAYWGKGYGTEAMNLVLRFAFEQLNLRRISLTVFEYNQRARQSYLKSGFKEEGRLRQWMQRSGERYDLIFMGILREEWEARQAEELDRRAAQNAAAPPG